MNKSNWKAGKMDGVSENYLSDGTLEFESYYRQEVLERVVRFDSGNKITSVEYYDPS